MASPFDSPLNGAKVFGDVGADASGTPERLRCTLHFAVAEPKHLHELMVGDAWVSFDRIQNFGLMYTCVAAWHLCACLSLCMIAQDDTECQLQKSPRVGST